MTNLVDEFSKFVGSNEETEKFLRSELDKSANIMRTALPFLETWYANSHASLGQGCLNVINQIKDFLTDYDQD